MMEYFVGIVPPNDHKERIIAFQKRWVSNQLWKVVEPHVTVKAQRGLGEDLTWLDPIRRVCASFPRFSVSLGTPETFDEAVAYLSVHSDQLRDFHEKLVSAVSPPPEIMRRYMEMDRFIPHLTLGQTHWGLNSDQILQMKETALTDLSPYPTFQLDFVRVYRKVESDVYAAYEDIALAE